MGTVVVRPSDLDGFVEECDRLGGPMAAAAQEYLSDFRFTHETRVDQSLDPFGDEYFGQQAALYREIAGRDLDQANGERSPVDVEAHTAGCNPYNTRDIRFVTRHARAIQTCLMVADLPPGAAVLDLGCGWGLSSELMAFAGARVTAVDINPPFAELVRRRAARLGLPVEVVESDFDAFADDRTYDLVLFYECLHHSLRPWVTLGRVGPRVKPGGKIVWGGEPVNQCWWVNWGLRLDGTAVYCMRKFGWWESGWSAEFLARCFDRCGFTLTVIPEVGLDGGPVGFAVRAEDAGRVRPDLAVVGPQAELAAYQLEVEKLRRHLDGMRSSLSWRVSAPVRALGRLSRRLRKW